MSTTPWWQYILQPNVLGVLLPIVALVIGGIVAIVMLVIRHRERMAMIEQGMNPDLPAPRGPTGGAE